MAHRQGCLQHGAVVFALSSFASAKECRTSGILENLSNTFARLGGTFKVVLRADLLCDGHALFRGYRSLARLSKLLNHTGVTSKVLFAANEDDRQASTEMHDLRNPLLLNVIKRVGRVNSEADEDDMRVRITKGSEAIVILLSGCIP